MYYLFIVCDELRESIRTNIPKYRQEVDRKRYKVAFSGQEATHVGRA